MTEVHYAVRFTRNMGDYESLQLEVGYTDMPRGEENAAQAYNRVKDFVDSRFFDAVGQVETDVVEIRKGIRAGKDYKRKVAQAGAREESEGK
jgi:hypothetical protein